ncbi:MAG: hypothetical protein ACRD3V_00820 [Vicinamibacteria bacterium]
MDPKEIEGVFQPRLKTGEPRISASMGLFISQNILKKHCGEILVESRRGEGSRFLVRFPMNLLESLHSPVPASTRSAAS